MLTFSPPLPLAFAAACIWAAVILSFFGVACAIWVEDITV